MAHHDRCLNCFNSQNIPSLQAFQNGPARARWFWSTQKSTRQLCANQGGLSFFGLGSVAESDAMGSSVKKSFYPVFPQRKDLFNKNSAVGYFPRTEQVGGLGIIFPLSRKPIGMNRTPMVLRCKFLKDSLRRCRLPGVLVISCLEAAILSLKSGVDRLTGVFYLKLLFRPI